ncbi:uncharacterized protein LY79DRAFT_547180 [Colletotrichum navitas]|uniref:Uncharacterized protein n=1 Tax=Colletotrichum navitas TaxID=681940 RepID=A0AAD8Q4U5_9PEZI|nr:uncharacterized protein LY79DRAFT_547180 [Colletotrichum navitas]KAK1595256.1 hypothetical protein LY79DRAFT_547180 [Colletotrichum navitas]
MIRKIEYSAHNWDGYRSPNLFQSAATLLTHCTSFQSLSIIIHFSWPLLNRLLYSENLPGKLLPDPIRYFNISSDGNDWRRLRNASVLHFQMSLSAGSEERAMISGLGASADHGNLKFCGEHGYVDTNAILVEKVQRLNTYIFQLGTHCNPNYAMDKPATGSQLQEALTRSNLDVYGDDRIGQSDRSGIVCRGARSRKLRARQTSSNGVLPEVAQNPKYIY